MKNKLKSYSSSDNLEGALDSVIEFGIAILLDSTTPATKYANKIIKYFEPFKNIDPILGFKMVKNGGYYYYVFDSNRFGVNSKELKKIIEEFDKNQ